ncbi:MAG: 4Fe-4S binding protein [Candidatus Lokiarchaeia archaeon]
MRISQNLVKFGMKLSNLPIIKRFFLKLFDPKNATVTSIPLNISLGTFENQVLPLKVTEYFINKASYIFLMNYCPCRKDNDCKEYKRSIGCTFIGKGVLRIKIPPERGHLATKEEAFEREHLAYENGLVPMLGKLGADSWIMGALPDEGHFMTLCHCCPCCCHLDTIKYATKSIRNIFRRMEGITVNVNRTVCFGCGKCLEVCIFDGMKIVDRKAIVDQDKCLGCGRCERKCPNGAITIKIDDSSCIDELIARFEAYVDVT